MRGRTLCKLETESKRRRTARAGIGSPAALRSSGSAHTHTRSLERYHHHHVSSALLLLLLSSGSSRRSGGSSSSGGSSGSSSSSGGSSSSGSGSSGSSGSATLRRSPPASQPRSLAARGRTDHAEHGDKLAGGVSDDGETELGAALGRADILDPLDVRVDIVAADRAQLDVALRKLLHVLGYRPELGRADRREVRGVGEQNACGPAGAPGLRAGRTAPSQKQTSGGVRALRRRLGQSTHPSRRPSSRAA